MAKIKVALNCPQCEEDIVSDEDTPECPKCHFKLGPRPQGYQLPEYCMEYFLKSKDPKWLRDVMVSLPIEKAKFLMQDADALMRVVTGKKCSEADIRNLAESAIAIGRMGIAVLDLLEAGCKHVPALYINITEENKNVQQLSKESPGSPGVQGSGSPKNPLRSFFD